MSDVHVKESSVDLKAGGKRDAVMGAIVEACRLDNRVTREQPLGLCAGVVPDFGLLQQSIFHLQPFRGSALKPSAGLLGYMNFVERQHIGSQLAQLLNDEFPAGFPTFMILLDV